MARMVDIASRLSAYTRLPPNCLTTGSGVARIASLAKYPLNENMCVFARECTGAAFGG
ncbi:hypothetical protein AWB81_06634 [Caballeronia arationis]|jgi:hypothetical protein|uniref:Uncharacterized protein n=1 Tax=Caballeronia arationis TaxID=1777142 RepID=A0A7Z7I683_9BURK|nr:hypothetical protein AWB81_06634 [Caballeronia arationis]SOE67182.1 hypothetical protein SAMN05446927_3243 [Caballeronia arationis]